MFARLKWAAPVVALGLMFGFAGTSAQAQDASAEKKETGSVSGVVKNAGGAVVEGAQVRLMKPFQRGAARGADKAEKQAARKELQAKKGDKDAKGERPAKGDRPAPVSTAQTDSEGKFTMSDVPPGQYVVMAMLRGQGNARQQIEVKAGETATVELTLAASEAGQQKPGRDKPAEGAHKHGDSEKQ